VRRNFLKGVAAAGLTAALPRMAHAATVIRVGLSARDLGSLDPAFGIGNGDEPVIRQIYNTLVSPPDGTLKLKVNELQGELAERWEMSPDARSWTFHLRPGVRWHKGYGEVTSEDVAFTLHRMGDPKTGSQYGSNYRLIHSVETPDPRTAVVRLSEPSPFFYALALMPRYGGYIQCKKAVQALGDKYALSPVGSGPFEFVSYEPKQKITLKAFDQYWGGKPAIDQIEMMYLPETSARTLAFVKGDIQMIESAITPGWLASLLRQMPDVMIDAGRPGGVNSLFINMTRKPLDNLKVREAIAHAIDQNVWQKAYGDLARPLYGLTPVGYYGALIEEDIPKDDWPYTFDPARSKALLAEADLPNGFSIDAFVTEREDYKTNMLIIQEQLRKVGIQINIRLVEHSTYHTDIRKDLDSLIVYSAGQPPLTQVVLENFYDSRAIVGKPTHNMNFSHFGDLAGNVDAKIVAANQETDDIKLQAMLKSIQIEIMRQVPMVPLPDVAGGWVHAKKMDIGFPVSGFMGSITLAKAKLS
jgi:peptide/nickel transport system substrate-binding protein